MALKDLTVTSSELTEAQIEEIVKDYIRYDAAAKQIAFLPSAASLQNRIRVLLYLVALQGWRFVTQDQVPTEATPAELERALNIPGGTLRPILKDLKDSHFIFPRGRYYGVRAAALPHIRKEISAAIGRAGVTHEASKSKRKKQKPSKQPAGNKSKGTGQGKGSRVPGQADFFDKLISGGFFEKPRTLSDVQNRFHEKGHIIARTSIPSLLLKAVRNEKLRRERQNISGKKVWTYERPK